MKPTRSVYLSLLAVLLMLAVGCNRARNDAQIAGDVVTKINSDSNVPTKQIAVTSNGGVVTLSGAVTSDMERAAAANDAAQVEGVKTVVNNLEVSGATTAAAAQAPPTPQQPEEQPQPEQPPARPSARRHSMHTSQRHESSTPPSTPAAAAAPVTATQAPQVATTPPPPPAPPKPVTIDSGTVLSVRMIDPVDTARNQMGDTFRATLDSPITIDDKVIIPQGADIQGRVAELKSAGKFAGQPGLALELTSLTVNGRRYSIHTDQYAKQGSSRGKNTAEKVGGGAAVGAIIGAIAGGGKGAAIGTVIGAGAGGGAQAASKAPTIHVPSEALLSFRLESPLTVTPANSIVRHRSSSVDQTTDYNSAPTDYSDNSRYNDNSSSSSSTTDQYPDDNNGPVLKRRK